MKISEVEPILCDGGWCPWVFAEVEADEDIVGYGKCSDHGTKINNIGDDR